VKLEPNFFGKDGFQWWLGVCEDRRDPQKLGRIKVRILGAHTEDKTLIKTKDLHWAYVYQPITDNPSMNGLGHSPLGPVEGSWLFGFWKDNESAQDPVIMGTIGGIPEEPPKPCIGFYDPSKPFHEIDGPAPRKIRIRFYPNDGTGAQLKNETKSSLYPRKTHPWGCELNEADTNRLARCEKVDDTIMGVRLRQRDNGRPKEFHGVPIAFVHPKPVRQWVEPKPGSHTSDNESHYPYCHVFESESGHIIEIDDTLNKERIHVWHRSGTYIEIGSGQEENPGLHGNFTLRCVGKRFEVTMEQSYSHYQNTMNVTVDGETNIYCRNDANLQVDGDLKVHVKGNYEERVHGNYTTDVDGDRIIKVGGSIKMAAGPLISGDAAQVHWNSGMLSGPPVVPPFPNPIRDWFETRNESEKDPEKEEKPDPNPDVCQQEDELP